MEVTDATRPDPLGEQQIKDLRTRLFSPDIEEEARPDVALDTLQRLDALFDGDLPRLLIQVCVEAPEETAWYARHHFLENWLTGRGYYHRGEMVDDLTRRLRSRGDGLLAAIRTAWIIGYRDDALTAELARIAGLQGEPHPEDTVQAYALAVLAALAYPDKAAVTRKLAVRLEKHGSLNEADCWTALQVATPEMIPALVQAAAGTSIAVHALLELAVRFPGSAATVWRAFEGLSDRAKLGQVGNAAERIDQTEVGRFLVRQVLSAFERHKTANVLPPTTQLLDANLPAHLQAFREMRETITQEARDWLRKPATASTGNRLRVRTAATFDKESAWKVLLRLGVAEARRWLPEAIAGETNFTLVELAEIAGFLQVAEAVDPLASKVQDETIDLGIGVGCLRALGVIGGPDALEALLRSRVRISRGERRLIPAAWVTAVAAASISCRSCDRIWEVLTDPTADPLMREAGAFALEELSGSPDAPLPALTDLVELLRNFGPELPGYDRLLMVLSDSEDAVAREFLREVGHTGHDRPPFIRALAFAGLLSEFPGLIASLGFQHGNGGWVAQRPLTDESALALLYLYRADPNFEPALLELLAAPSFRPAAQVVGNLRKDDNLSPAVREALWERVLSWNGPNASDSSALTAIARTQPERLLREETVTLVSRWGSSARRAYLGALRTVWEVHGMAGPVARTACDFLMDEEGDVRRDAARLVRHTERELLEREVEKLAAQAEGLHPAVCALEAAFWLEAGWDVYEQLGKTHREGIVRDLAARLTRERHQTQLARKYVDYVLDAEDYLEVWCYGQALLELGNEDTLAALCKASPAEVYRRAYLTWLSKGLEKRLEDRRSKQAKRTNLPPPISQESQVQVTVSCGAEVQGTYPGTLQEIQRQTGRRWLWEWSIQIEDQPELSDLFGFDGPVNITLADGRHGRVLPVSSYTRITADEERAFILMLGKGSLYDAIESTSGDDG